MVITYRKAKRNKKMLYFITFVILTGLLVANLLMCYNKPIPEPEIIVEHEIVYVEVEKKEPTEPIEEIIFDKEPRYGFTDDEVYLMTVLLCGSKDVDGDGEYDIDFENYDNRHEIAVVLGVVMNRVMSDYFPNNVADVIWAPNQFTPMKRWTTDSVPVVSERSFSIVKAWCDAYDAYDLSILSAPENHLFFSASTTYFGNVSREEWK